MKNLKLSFYTIMLVSCASLVIYSYKLTQKMGENSVEEVENLPVVSLEEAFPYVIEPNSTLFAVLRDLDIPPQTIQDIVTAAKPIENLGRLKPGIRFQIFRDTNLDLTGIQFRFSALESLDIKKEAHIWNAKKLVEHVDIKVVTFSGIVSSSLWESAVKAKMDPNLISELADIFGWEVDFSREVRIDDRWRLTVEQKLVKGETIGWGAILAAEYENAGTPYQAVLFRHNGEEIGYFSPEGASLRKMFLKSPIRYGRITSRFTTRRFHPILKVNRAHLGVDYAAPIGTPIRAVGDATVTMAQYNGGAGNMVRLRHNASYQTVYKHLKGFAKGIRSGSRVKQGQVIGYVGNTGLSTGPHLHFEFYKSGRYADPLRIKFPSSNPVASEHLAQFKTDAISLLTGLPSWESVDVTDRDLSTDSTKKPN